jgi:hypothetical protein
MRSHEQSPSNPLTTTVSMALLASLALAACRPAAMIGPEPNEPATQPTATGAAQHQAAAKREEARLEQHQKLYDPRATQSVRRCDAAHVTRSPGEPICWLETVNPTAVHLKEIEDHRLRAAEHRRAARELRAIEEQACAGVAPEDRDVSPFSHRADILGVSPLEDAPGKPKAQRRILGATVVFRPVPGLTASELQRLVDCHLARNATIGYETASREMDHCLLTQRGARASVRSLESGFAVDVKADDSFAGREIWRRAQALAAVD